MSGKLYNAVVERLLAQSVLARASSQEPLSRATHATPVWRSSRINAAGLDTSMARSIGTTLTGLFNAHERMCMLRILASNDNPDKAAEALRKMLFGVRLRLEKEGCDYYKLSTRIAYHFHKDRKSIVDRLSL
jgi:hypothetical protein